ncbi:glycosyltransferase [Prochlorococcus marinus]|uniref:glycosyltransferase n=1 Tax=Prochlorococcus marinus TaxID=1219 RepID=UPI0022B2B7A7|nr:glycosyltransferase [Prochlorococcus marinus]
MENNIACVIPCFNEANRIDSLIKEILSLNSSDIDWYLLDNGSIDDTQDRICQLSINKLEAKNIMFIRKNINEGYGSGIKYAFKNIVINNSYKVFCWTHGDGQTPLNDILLASNLLKIQTNGFYLIKGKRLSRKDGTISYLFTFVLNLILFILGYRQAISPNSQPTSISVDLMNKIINKLPEDGKFDIAILLYIIDLGVKISRFNVHFLEREQGEGANESIDAKIIYSINMLKYIFKWKIRHLFSNNISLTK